MSFFFSQVGTVSFFAQLLLGDADVTSGIDLVSQPIHPQAEPSVTGRIVRKVTDDQNRDSS